MNVAEDEMPFTRESPAGIIHIARALKNQTNKDWVFVGESDKIKMKEKELVSTFWKGHRRLPSELYILPRNMQREHRDFPSRKPVLVFALAGSKVAKLNGINRSVEQSRKVCL